MELSIPVTSQESAHLAVLTARPTGATDGIDAGTLQLSGYHFTQWQIYFLSAGADVTITKLAASNAVGVEVWVQHADKAGDLKWWLAGTLNGNADIIVYGAAGAADGGAVFTFNAPAGAKRIAIVGTSSDGAHIPLFYVEPVEHIMQVVS